MKLYDDKRVMQPVDIDVHYAVVLLTSSAVNPLTALNISSDVTDRNLKQNEAQSARAE